MATPRSLPFEQLFDAAFLEEVARLRLIARRVPRGGRFAEQRSQQLGSGIEFRDFRPYAPGDDLRAVDWNIYRRLGRVFLRLFEELEDLPLYLLPDVSESLFVEEPPRALAGFRTTLALASIAAGQHDTVALLPFDTDLHLAARPRAGTGRTLFLARRLAAIEPGGRTDLARALRRLGGLDLRRGLVAVISDFFDPNGLDTVLAELGRLRHRLLLVQLVRPSDRDPRLTGDLRLLDCETGHAENVSVTSKVLERYRAAYDRFAAALAEFASARGAGLIRLDVEAPIVPQLATLFEKGAFVA